MIAYTDYPFTELGDTPGEEAPVRKVKVLSYDDDKYCRIKVDDNDIQTITEIKAGYLYQTPGRCGEVCRVSINQLKALDEEQ